MMLENINWNILFDAEEQTVSGRVCLHRDRWSAVQELLTSCIIQAVLEVLNIFITVYQFCNLPRLGTMICKSMALEKEKDRMMITVT